MAKAQLKFTLSNKAEQDITAVLIPPAIQRTEGYKGRFLQGILFKDFSGNHDISVSNVAVVVDPRELNLVPDEANPFELIGDPEKIVLSKIQQFAAAYDVEVTGAAVKSQNGLQYTNAFSRIVDLPFVEATKKQAIKCQTDANGGQSFNPESGLIYQFVEPLKLTAANRDTGLVVELEAGSSVDITLNVEFHTAAAPKYIA